LPIRFDEREDYGEERFLLIGMVELISVIYAGRRGRMRRISARRATGHEQDHHFAKGSEGET